MLKLELKDDFLFYNNAAFGWHTPKRYSGADPVGMSGGKLHTSPEINNLAKEIENYIITHFPMRDPEKMSGRDIFKSKVWEKAYAVPMGAVYKGDDGRVRFPPNTGDKEYLRGKIKKLVGLLQEANP